MQVVASLITSQKVFLDSPDWRSIPWALDPMAKPQQSYLVDILATVPGILQDHMKLEKLINRKSCDDSFRQTSGVVVDESTGSIRPGDTSTDSEPPPVSVLHGTLVARVKDQLETLFCWRWRWQVLHGHTVSVERSTTVELNSTAAKVLGSMGTPRHLSRLSFSRPDSAADMMLYNAVLMWLLALLWDFEPLVAGDLIEAAAESARKAVTSSGDSGSVASKFTSFSPLCRPGGNHGVRDPAVEICQVYEWQSRHHGSNREPNFLYMFPIGMAMAALDSEPDMRKWIRVLLDADPVTRGYASQATRPAPESGATSENHDTSSTSSKDDDDIDNARGRATAAELGQGTNMATVSGFGFYVTREIMEDKNAEQELGRGYMTEQQFTAVKKLGNPGLVHLLLLRGRMAAI